MEQEVNMKTTCIAIQSSEKAGQAFMRGLNGFVEKQKSVIRSAGSTNKSAPNKEVAGKIVKVKDLRKDGSQVEYVDMGNDELKNFRKYARKYGVTYSMEKNKATSPPTYLIYFKAKDSTLINKAISEYVSDTLKGKNKSPMQTLKDKLVKAKAKSANQPKKLRNKEQIR